MKRFVSVLCFVAICIVFNAASLAAQDVINREVGKAMKELSNVVLKRVNVSINEITMAGTKDMTSEFSVYLYPIIKHHAVTNSNSMFNVVDEPRSRGLKTANDQSTGVISGTYNKRGNTVEVYLNLNIDGNLKGSYRFTIPISELAGISVLPDNFKTPEEAVKQDNTIAVITGTANQTTQADTAKQQPVSKPDATPTAQNIQITAWFDSQLGNRVYMHREPLEITVTADKDCYFKVIHIDVNNQMKMIFPNSDDRNNFIKANTSRAVFEKTSYRFYGPYGAETLLITASTEQFVNIEKEYATPWITATADSVKATVGNRGGDIEYATTTTTQKSEGEARYTITILKPNEEYEFIKPVSMTEFVQSMRSDAEKQGGTFNKTNNETSGDFNLNNMRVSYRVPRNKPDMIEFAYYNLNNLPSGIIARGQTRGAGFTFSFDKPGNIPQTIQAVRSGIESKGGVFQGNEKQGNFKASGIEGQYQVLDLVSVTITNKPMLIPNSMIEKEVKNYFGGK